MIIDHNLKNRPHDMRVRLLRDFWLSWIQTFEDAYTRVLEHIPTLPNYGQQISEFRSFVDQRCDDLKETEDLIRFEEAFGSIRKKGCCFAAEANTFLLPLAKSYKEIDGMIKNGMAVPHNSPARLQ